MKRCEEVRKLLSMGPEELVEKANGKLVILDTLDELHEHFARVFLFLRNRYLFLLLLQSFL